MDTQPIDFIPWGLDASWPTRCWLEPIFGRRNEPPRGLRLAHASDTAMVLVCTHPRARFDVEIASAGADPIRELAYETTFTLINLVLHQIRVPGERPEGLVSSLMQFATQQANRHREWATTHWGLEAASIIGLAGWQSGYTLAYPESYVIVHACGIDNDTIRLQQVRDFSPYEPAGSPFDVCPMHWELWRSESALGYEDLTRVLVSD
jgi:hypothetical protein